MNQFEKEVRKACIDKEMSLRELSKCIGITQSYLCDIFKGARQGSKQKELIVEILGIDVSLIEKGA